MISICVITYNHEKYLRKCLDGILDQKINYPIEIVIRDDLSSDSTPEIIAEYANKYPKLIRNILSKNNIGANANLLKVFNEARGQFIAICEGDDFWIDCRKLEKQLHQALEHPDVDFFTHPAFTGSEKKPMRQIWACELSKTSTLHDILNCPGQFAPTSSYFFRRESLYRLPNWFKNAPIGDFFLEIYITGLGKTISSDSIMSHYRTLSLDSWDDKIKKDTSGEKGVYSYRKMKIYTRKAALDFPHLKSFFEIKMGYMNSAIAYQNIKSGNYKNYLLYLEKAGPIICGFKFKSLLLYKTRKMRLIFFTLHYYKKYIK